MTFSISLAVGRIGVTTDARARAAEDLGYVLRPGALTHTVGRHIPQDRAGAMAWALWYIDPRRPDALRANARVCTTGRLSLPNGLPEASQARIAEAFMRDITGGRQEEIPWRFGFHRGLEPGEDGALRNDHCHFQIHDRTVRPARRRAVVGLSDRRDEAEFLRGAAVRAIGAEMARLGIPVRVEARSLFARHVEALLRGDVVAAAALDRPPLIHVGPAARGRAARGEGHPPPGPAWAHLGSPSREAECIRRDRLQRKTKGLAAALAVAPPAMREDAWLAMAGRALARLGKLRGALLRRAGGPGARDALGRMVLTRARGSPLPSLAARPIPHLARPPRLGWPPPPTFRRNTRLPGAGDPRLPSDARGAR